jgi:hypothetical protein
MAAATGDMVSAGFAELERQQQLLATCTRLYQQLQDHFGSLECGLAARSASSTRSHPAPASPPAWPGA